MYKTMENVDNLEEYIKEILGTEEFLNAITRALSYDTKSDIYNYIKRMYDL